MSITLRRLRPTRTTLGLLVGLLWALSFGAVRDFVWADLKTGFIELRGLSRATRGLVVAGLVLLFVMVAALLFNDLWRARFSLLAVTAGSPGRGELIPSALVPVTFFVLTVAWSFMLAGALHSHAALRVAVLAIYTVIASAWTGASLLGTGVGVGSTVEVWLSWGTVALVPLFFTLRWRAHARPMAEFVVLLLAVGATFVLAQGRLITLSRLSGSLLVLSILGYNIISLTTFAFPFLYLIGLDMAEFVQHAAGWTTEVIVARLPRAALYATLFVLLPWRLRDVIVETLERVDTAPSVGRLASGYAGALGIPVLVILLWWLIARRSREEAQPANTETIAQAAAQYAPWLILGIEGLGLLTQMMTLTVSAFTYVGLEDRLQLSQIQEAGSWVTASLENWFLLVAVVAGLAAAWLVRRGRRPAALYLGAFAATLIWNIVTWPDRPLARLGWRGSEPIDFWWVVILGTVAGWWLLRRALTAGRAARLLFVVLMTALLRQTDFIENPFSPFFGFAGIGFIAFGIVWDAMTAGSWANESTPAFPRLSRIFLYLGYVLFTVTLVNWVLTVHSLSYVESFTGNAALGGLTLIGKPMLYAIFVVLLTAPAEPHTPPETPPPAAATTQ